MSHSLISINSNSHSYKFSYPTFFQQS